MPESAPHIGTLGEKPLHASLKRWYSHPSDSVECPVDGFVIDLVRDDLLIEIQTRGFSSMRRKVASLLDQGHRLRIVHPIAVDRWIVRVDDDGTILSRRRSPKHGRPLDIFAELVSFPDLLATQNLQIELLMTVEEEYRVHTPGKSWRRDGWSVLERRLVEVLESVLLDSTDDAAALLPPGLPEPFTTGDLSTGLGCPLRTAQQMAYCLRESGAISPVGKRGRAIEYSVT